MRENEHNPEVCRVVAGEVAYLRCLRHRTTNTSRWKYSGGAYYHALQACIEMGLDRPRDGDCMKLSFCNLERGGKRVKIKTGKWVRRYFGVARSDDEIHKMGAMINARLWSDNTVRVLRGEDVREFYRKGNPSSCMTGDASDFLDIYADNPDKVGLAVVELPDGQAARALVWTLDRQDGLYMDRVYDSGESARQALYRWGEENTKGIYGYWDGEVALTIRQGERSYWPYMDSLLYVTIRSETECVLSTKRGDHELRTTEGTLMGEYTCSCCDSVIAEEDVLLQGDSYYCIDCFHESFSYCDECGECEAQEHCRWVESAGRTVCDSCLEQRYKICDRCDEYYRIHDESLTHMEDTNSDLCSSCMEWVGAIHCSACDGWYEEEGKVTDDGDGYCAECYDECFWRCEKCDEEFRVEDAEDVDGVCADCVTDKMMEVGND